MPFNYFEILRLAAPETIVILTALVVLGIDLLVLRTTLSSTGSPSAAHCLLRLIGAMAWTLNGHGSAVVWMGCSSAIL